MAPTLRGFSSEPEGEREIRPEGGPIAKDKGFSGDAALQRFNPVGKATPTIPSRLLTFEGLSNQDNFNLHGFRVNPPDPVGDVGPNNYVEMVNLAFAVYDKQGHILVQCQLETWGRTLRSPTAQIHRAMPSSYKTNLSTAGS